MIEGPADVLSIVGDVWEDLLGARPISPAEDFFDEAGGDSFTALALVTTLGDRYGCALSLKEFFSDPTSTNLVSQVVRSLAK